MAFYCIPSAPHFPPYVPQGWNHWNIPAAGVDGPYHTIPVYYIVPIPIPPPQIPTWQNDDSHTSRYTDNVVDSRQQSFPTYNMWSSHPLACLQNIFARPEGSSSPDSAPTSEESQLEIEEATVQIQDSEREELPGTGSVELDHNESYADVCKKENTGTTSQTTQPVGRSGSPLSPAQSKSSSSGSGTNNSTSSKRRRRSHKKPEAKKYIDSLKWCPFCRRSRSKSPKGFFKTHPMRDPDGFVICPILSKLICPKCGATGAFSHTLAYCPFRDFNPKDEQLQQASGPSSDSD